MTDARAVAMAIRVCEFCGSSLEGRWGTAKICGSLACKRAQNKVYRQRRYNKCRQVVLANNRRSRRRNHWRVVSVVYRSTALKFSPENDNLLPEVAVGISEPIPSVTQTAQPKPPAPAKGFSMFYGLPKVPLRQNKPWRRLDLLP